MQEEDVGEVFGDDFGDVEGGNTEEVVWAYGLAENEYTISVPIRGSRTMRKGAVGSYALEDPAAPQKDCQARRKDQRNGVHVLKLYPILGPTHVSLPDPLLRQYPSVPNLSVPAYSPVE